MPKWQKEGRGKKSTCPYNPVIYERFVETDKCVTLQVCIYVPIIVFLFSLSVTQMELKTVWISESHFRPIEVKFATIIEELILSSICPVWNHSFISLNVIRYKWEIALKPIQMYIFCLKSNSSLKLFFCHFLIKLVIILLTNKNTNITYLSIVVMSITRMLKTSCYINSLYNSWIGPHQIMEQYY